MGEEIFRCPICGEVFIRDPQGFWKCPRCGAELWPDESKLAYLEQERRSQEYEEKLIFISKHTLCRASFKPVLPPVCVVDWKKSGSRSSGRRRKKPSKSALMTERYQLC